MDQQTKDLVAYLWQFVTSQKQERMAKILAERTEYITVVLENIEQSHNASAVLRSCDIMGVQSVQVIEEFAHFSPNHGIARGACQWITTNRYTSTMAAYAQLRAQGYSIIATTPQPGACVLSELPVDKKIAFVFGSEDHGLSQTALDGADGAITIPMVGFTESFNISVSVALCLYDTITRLRASTLDWHLNDAQKDAVLLSWLRRSVPKAAVHERVFLQNYTKE